MIITAKEEYKNLKDGSEKRVKLKCDMCGKITETAYNNYILAQKKHNRNGETYCRGCASKINGKKRRGTTAWNKGKKFPELSGENSPTWNGGKYISSDGYRMIYIGKSEGSSGWNSYKKEHRIIMEEVVGRKLKKDEVIHHIDGDKLNNDVNNLFLIKKHKHHKLIHNSLQQIGYELYKLGLVSFSKERKQYEMAHIKFRELLEHPEEGNQQPSFSSNALEGSETSSET